MKPLWCTPFNRIVIDGMAERLKGTFMTKVHVIMAAPYMPLLVWAEALSKAKHLRNSSPVAAKDKSPCKLMFGIKPSMAWYQWRIGFSLENIWRMSLLFFRRNLSGGVRQTDRLLQTFITSLSFYNEKRTWCQSSSLQNRWSYLQYYVTKVPRMQKMDSVVQITREKLRAPK